MLENNDPKVIVVSSKLTTTRYLKMMLKHIILKSGVVPLTIKDMAFYQVNAV